MLKRKAETLLKEWKNKKDRKCLIVQGARQVGKTFLIEHFGEENYGEVLEINFKQLISAADLFNGDLNIETIVNGLKFRFPDKKIIPGRTLIFLDEIQECPEAISSLKFWAIDNRYDVIASGSLPGIDYKRASSYPVGYVDYIHMHALDFEEFLWGLGISEDMIGSLKDCFESRRSVPDPINRQMMNYYREYIAVGGMPEVVCEYVRSKDFREVDRIQRALLQSYQYDIVHYATAEEKIKAEKCYLSLSRQLLDKENHKFQYKELEHGGRAQKYYSSIEWLLKADIIQLCRFVSAVRYDLDDYARDDFFRAYTTDLSLLISMKDLSLKQHIIENTLSGNTKGGLYECAVADALYKKDYSLYFYKNDSTKKEIDFLIQKQGNVVPIEIKSSNTRASSLNSLIKNNPEISLAYKLIDGNVGINEEGIVTIPLYMGMFI